MLRKLSALIPLLLATRAALASNAYDQAAQAVEDRRTGDQIVLLCEQREGDQGCARFRFYSFPNGLSDYRKPISKTFEQPELARLARDASAAFPAPPHSRPRFYGLASAVADEMSQLDDGSPVPYLVGIPFYVIAGFVDIVKSPFLFAGDAIVHGTRIARIHRDERRFEATIESTTYEHKKLNWSISSFVIGHRRFLKLRSVLERL
ncbi:MAG: hypothetical protein HYW49_00075 [Deltaproteobacteria bacterium]|nr:hypothetical protein [Deltaproteobacteria bacterium]